jgi:hypothetical protein
LQKLEGVYFTKNGHEVGISCSKEQINNFATDHAIFAQTSSIGAAACQIKLESLNEITKNSFQGALFCSLPMWISSQNPLLNNFSSVQPTLSSSTFTDRFSSTTENTQKHQQCFEFYFS